MMNQLTLFLALFAGASAFTAPTAFKTSSSTSLNAYVPDGLTPEQYRQIKQQEVNRLKNKNLGRLGPRGFKSRSMEAWQKAYERGETGHSFAPVGWREKLSQGQLKWEDVPYMVRGGSWDNSDVRGARRLKWTREDREYSRGGYQKEQSVSILGSGPGLDWTGSRDRTERTRIVPGFS